MGNYTQLDPDYAEMAAALATVDKCPHCGGTDLDMYPAGTGYSLACDDCGLSSPILNEPDQAAAWWQRLCRTLAAGDAKSNAITITLPVEQAEQLVLLATSMFDGLEPSTDQGKTVWAATVGQLQVVANDGCVDAAMRGLRAIREATNAATRVAPYNAREKAVERMFGDHRQLDVNLDPGKDYRRAEG